MKRYIVFPLIFFLFTTIYLQAKNYSFRSPNRNVSVKVYCDGEPSQLSYEIIYDNEVVLKKSRFGIILNNNDLGSNITIGGVHLKKMNDQFNILGNHSSSSLSFTEVKLPVLTDKEKYTIELRIYNDGVAVRSLIDCKDSCLINGEILSWELPKSTKLWFQSNTHSYEGLFKSALNDTLPTNSVLALPVTACLKNNKYLVLTEADVNGYSDLSLKAKSGNHLVANFNADKKGWKNKGKIIQPWRVVLIANNLNDLVNNDVVYSLCDKSKISSKNSKWIKPGKSTWQWWSSGDPKYEEQNKWIDWTASLGFEYYLIDDGWKKWHEGTSNEWECLKKVVRNAKNKGVNCWLWVNSKEVNTSSKRQEYFQKVVDCGIVGIKIDFMPEASAKWSSWYDETLADAARYRLMVDFHGAVKPSGRCRTWPNEMTREGLRGHEWHILRYKRTLPPSHDCILPFTRYIQGAGDYTPTVLNPTDLRGFTWAREIAQAIVFTSPFLCFADSPEYYLKSEALDIIKSISSIWDETIVLPQSEIGKRVVMARRKGNEWFVAVINGDGNSEIKIDYSFLKKGKEYKSISLRDNRDDYKFLKTVSKVKKEDSTTLNIKPAGGYVEYLSEL